MTPLTLAAGGDHAAFPLRGWLIELLRGHGYLPSTAQHPALSKAILATAKPPNAARFDETAAIPSDNRRSESLLDSMIGRIASDLDAPGCPEIHTVPGWDLADNGAHSAQHNVTLNGG